MQYLLEVWDLVESVYIPGSVPLEMYETIHFWNPYDKTNTEFDQSMFQFLTYVELSRSMAAILEMPQYVAFSKNVVLKSLMRT